MDFVTRSKTTTDLHLQPLNDHDIALVNKHLFGSTNLDDDVLSDIPSDNEHVTTRRRKRKGKAPNIQMTIRRLSREVEKMCARALVNKYVVSGFIYKNWFSGKKSPALPNIITWEDEIPRTAWSEDGVLLQVYLPGLIKEKGLRAITELLLSYGTQYPPSQFKTRVSRGEGFSYVELENPKRIVGEARLSRGWLALGRKGAENLVTSSDMIRSGKVWMGSCNLLHELRLLSYRVNACFQYATPDFYESLLLFRQRHLEAQKAIEAISSIDPLLVENREILFNVLLTEHTDSQDPRKGMAAFTVFGKFTGGYMLHRRLGLRTRFSPGDVNLLRSRVVPHEIEPFTGQRIAIPHFTHTTSWKAVGLEHLVDSL